MKFPACRDGSELDFTEEVRRLRSWKGQLKLNGMNVQRAWEGTGLNWEKMQAQEMRNKGIGEMRNKGDWKEAWRRRLVTHKKSDNDKEHA